MIALAVMWGYDLHLYTVAYFTRGFAQELFAMRGAVLAAVVPLFALALRKHSNWKVQLSRAATFQSVSLPSSGLSDRDDVRGQGDGAGRGRLGPGGAAGHRAFDDRCGADPAAIRSSSGLAPDLRCQACFRASLRLSNRVAAIHRHRRPRRTGQSFARGFVWSRRLPTSAAPPPACC
jgi:hypothetical protein